MITHILKCHPLYFKDICRGLKTFEIRKNDRDFKEGDLLTLREYDPTINYFSGNVLKCRILYVLHDFEAIKKGYVVLSIFVIKYEPLQNEIPLILA